MTPTADPATIRGGLAHFLVPGTVAELRVPKTRWGTLSGYFDDLDRLAAEAARVSGTAPGVYFTPNPVRPDLLARSVNRLKERADHTTADSDVVRRHWLLIDADPTRPAGISSTDLEHAAALERIEVIGTFLEDQGVPRASLLRADSGNGGHLAVRTDEPNDSATHSLFTACLAALDLEFSDGVVQVDTSVSNAARIWKAYGTPVCKGDPTPERPHRLARLLQVPEHLVVMPRATLERLAALAPQLERPTGGVGVPFDLEVWLRRQGLQVRSSGPWNGGRKWILAVCPWNSAHTNGAAYIVQLPNGAIGAGCHHNGCVGQSWVTLRDLLEPGRRAAATPRGGGQASVEPVWGPLGELPSPRPAVPDVPDVLLPEPLRPWLVDTAERTAVPLALVSAPALIALAAVVGRTVGIRPKRHDDWLVVPNLWGATVARPGFLKSASAQEALRPLHRLAARASETYQAALVEAERNKKRLELRLNALKDQLRAAAKAGDDVEALLAEVSALEEEVRTSGVTERRYLTQDSTVEKLGELLRQNPRGLLLQRDEIAGWLRTLDKPGREGEREFYLEAWNGTGAYTFDRIGRGTVHIPAVTVSLFGTLQPAKLAAYLEAALDDAAASNDGLLQRFQVLVWPDDLGTWRNVDRWPDTAARDRVYALFQALDELDPATIGAEAAEEDTIPALRFAAPAQELFDAWRGELEQRLRSRELAQAPAFESHLAKYRSLMPALALLFHLTDLAGGGRVAPVSLRAAQRGAAWCELLEQHAQKVYAAELAADQQGAVLLSRKIERGLVYDGMPLRELYRMGWHGLKALDAVHAAVEALAAVHWCQIQEPGTGGRPSRVLRLHPDLRRRP